MTKLIVFDVDGTILDSWGGFRRIVEMYSRDNGLPIPCFDSIRRGYHDPHSHDYKWGLPPGDEQARHLYATFSLSDRYATSGDPEHTPLLFDGAEDLLTELKDLGYTLAIITSKAEDPVQHMFEYHNIGSLFSAWRCLNDIRRRGEKEKPEPDMLFSVMEELGHAPEDTVMIGDTTMDIMMGCNAGTSTIGVTWGTHPRHMLETAGAHHIVETQVKDVGDVIRRIFENGEGR